jgi:endonuclease/exonuclease/phosphatase family metal-dependent hydrolase
MKKLILITKSKKLKKYLIAIIVFVSSFNLFAQFENLSFGTDSTLDIVTWNIEHFPKNGQTTLNYVTQIIEAMDIDVLAIQEVQEYDDFEQLIANLEGWEGDYAWDQYAALAYIYKTDVVENVNLFEIYTNKSREFPRAPYVMEMTSGGVEYVIMNNHLKCCGDGHLDESDDYDEEKRRLDACNLIDDYIVENYPNKRVIMLGDLNDILTDNNSNNVFKTFINNPDSYAFADMDIAEGSNSNWSYPSWPSHLDHILITNEIFDDFATVGSEILTVKLDNYFNSFNDYDYNVSDHRPVGLKIKRASYLGVNDLLVDKSNFFNYPNPIKNQTTFTFNAVKANTVIEIVNIQNQKIQEINLSENQNSVVWNINNLPSGIYYSKLIENKVVIGVRKLIIR